MAELTKQALQDRINNYTLQLQKLEELGGTNTLLLEIAQELTANKDKLQGPDLNLSDILMSLDNVESNINELKTEYGINNI